MSSPTSLKPSTLIGLLIVLILLIFLGVSTALGVDSALSLISVVFPTALSVIPAMQALKPPDTRHRRNWSIMFIVVGLIGSSVVYWQQQRAARQAADERVQLRSQLERVQFPIEDVLVTFRVNIPLDDPILQGYRERLDKCVEEIIKSQQARCGAVQSSVNINQASPIDSIYIAPGAELYPNPNRGEYLAYNLINYTRLEFFLFKPVREINAFTQIEKADSSFKVTRVVDSPENSGPNNVALHYEISTRTLYLFGFRIPVATVDWKTNGRVTSIPDLSGSTVVIRPMFSIPLFNMEGGRNENSEILTRAAARVTLQSVTLNMARGNEFTLPVDKFKIIRDARGYPIYSIDWPFMWRPTFEVTQKLTPHRPLRSGSCIQG